MSYAIARETYYTALYALLAPLQSAGTVVTLSRRLARTAEEHAPAELPALYLVLGERHKTANAKNRRPIRQLQAHAIIYVANPDAHTAAGIALNRLIDAVEAAIAPAVGATQTLGNLVNACWIGEETETFENISGERATAIVPIEMEIP